LPALACLSGCITEYGIVPPVYDHPTEENRYLYFNPDDDERNLVFEFRRYYGYPFTCAEIYARSRLPHQKLLVHEVVFTWKNKKRYIVKNRNLELSMGYNVDYKGSGFYWDNPSNFYKQRIHVYTTSLFRGLGLKKPKWKTEKYDIVDEMPIPVTIVYSYEDGIVRTETDTFTVYSKRRDAIELPWFIAALSR
jgi:hypothetical protein